LLAIDLFEGECFFQANPVAQSKQIAHYFADLAAHYQSQGIEKLIVYLDNNPTHKNKMKTLYEQLTENLSIHLDFRYIAPYSPKLNLVEYAIHILRQKVTHQADCKTSLQEFEEQINELAQQKIFSKNQIINILEHIESLVK
jgi:transposase